MLALIRHHFEPNFDLKAEQQSLNPGYSRLRIFKDGFRDEDAVEIAEEYFRGIKEIVFVSSNDAMLKIVKELEVRFIERKIRPNKKELVIDTWKAQDVTVKKSYSIKDLDINDFGNPPASMPYFNERIERVIMRAETQYALQLKEKNLIGLKECMIQIHNLVDSGKLMAQGHKFKYVFVDEFQDTDDAQIETITGLQKIFGSECRLFVVGDFKQSIYRFRGATLSAFEKVTGINGVGKWKEYILNRNYRTDSRLLDRFHFVFSEMGNYVYVLF